MPITDTFLLSSRRTVFAVAVLASTAWTPVALAKEFPRAIPLSSLNGTTGFRLDGTAGSLSGWSVANAGDVNGDGFADIIVGAFRAAPRGSYSGSTYIIFGKASGFLASMDLAALDGNNGFRLDGAAAGDESGWAVGSAGDVNGDGFGDIIVGARGTGSGYIVFGKSTGFPEHIDLSALDGKTGFRIEGASGGGFGKAFAGAGDLNGDGFADVIIGSPYDNHPRSQSGSTYVVFGKASGFGAALNLSTLDGSNGFRVDGSVENDLSGFSAASAGDVNGDGFTDVIIGARSANPHGEESGSSYVVFGKPSGFAAAFNLSSLDGTNGFRLDGVAYEDQSGYTVAGAGDINGDGFADVVVGARFAQPHGIRSGSSYVVFGRASGFGATLDLSTLNGSNGFRVDGPAAYDYSGRSVASAGDVNGDGFADVIIGAHGHDPLGSSSGSSYVVFGKSSGFPASINPSSLDGTDGIRLDGVSANDYSGRAVHGGGDVNGDGFADVIVGAYAAAAGSGSTYVVFGRAPDSARTRIGSAADQYISGGAFNDTLEGKGGLDILEGRGGADTLIGGADHPDTASYLHAPTGVTASLATPAINTGDAAGDSYRLYHLTGSRFADRLIGNDGQNRLTGDLGADELTGAGGRDLFTFNKVSDSRPGAGHDKITDFEAGDAATSVDRIDLRAIDARTGPGNQAFEFIGAAPFSSTKGELRVRKAGSSAIVEGDVDGDGNADLEIELENVTDLSKLTEIDFRL